MCEDKKIVTEGFETADETQYERLVAAAGGQTETVTESQFTKAGYWTIGLILALIAAFVIWDGARIIERYRETQSVWMSMDYSAIVFVGFGLYYLLGLGAVKYRLELGSGELICTYKTIFGSRRYRVPYENIYGVHPHRPRLVNNIRFRYKRRWYSVLDSRETWAMFYAIPRPGKKPQYVRAMFNPSPQFLLAMDEYLPGLVGLSEEETTYNVLVGESRRRDALEAEKHRAMQEEN